MEPTLLIDRYCDAWSEPDAKRRADILASVWSPAATYTDPSVYAASIMELLTHISKVQLSRPGAKVLRTSTVDVHHGIARFSWHVVQANGVELPEGLDVAFISIDGKRIERIVGFFGVLGSHRQE